jgi:DUF177 domain-containing protein
VLINVSTLLREPLGSTRDYRADDELAAVPSAGYERRVSGRVRLIRSERGILVTARLTCDVELVCARCAKRFTAVIPIDFDEEYVSLDDPHATARGRQVDPDDFLVDEFRHVDLSEAIRQYEESALPLLPLCRADCAGLCPVCGSDLNETRCACDGAQDEGRWEALSALARELRTREDGHGGSQA